ncbi:hypothetical protein I4I73_16190 [Pseudonocardia sp. KRD-184]|uniref:Uncharacterized protein n=1 Tax=Pseudonocardia oceani TaxID=2792013 RepID=A0ABS6U3P3_9PSEU|nr:hypothetical protein [Pseudonocardia oceani]MBW0093859.1 hypothetical protein [Pseudonocardia oceani]MBW0097523.1 hypothetical protein [Pseudonocardia oceani]MBW0126849.1 hypothetical protein [Pseudonocardia oceani]
MAALAAAVGDPGALEVSLVSVLGAVVEVGQHWFFHGPIAARLMLDDLERRYA